MSGWANSNLKAEEKLRYRGAAIESSSVLMSTNSEIFLSAPCDDYQRTFIL